MSLSKKYYLSSQQVCPIANIEVSVPEFLLSLSNKSDESSVDQSQILPEFWVSLSKSIHKSVGQSEILPEFLASLSMSDVSSIGRQKYYPRPWKVCSRVMRVVPVVRNISFVLGKSA